MESPGAEWRPPTALLRFTAYAACLVIIAFAATTVFGLLEQMGIVFFPIVTSVFLMRVLAVPAGWLSRRGWPPAAAAIASVIGFVVALVMASILIAQPMAEEFDTLAETLTDGTEQVEDWLIDDSAFDIDRNDIETFKEDVSTRAGDTLENSTDTIARGAQLVIEILVGFVLALVLAFFFLKDGPQFYRWVIGLLPRRHRPTGEVLIRSAWNTLGGYLRGASLLGLLESVVIGLAMALTGASLVVPVMVLTFLGAFIPLVGATVAGVLAVLITLASAGLGPAAIVAVVAIVVQQLDSDLLAPWVYGKELDLHPAVILLSIVTGTALFGIAGTLLAVPVVGTGINGFAALSEQRRGRSAEAPPVDPAPS